MQLCNKNNNFLLYPSETATNKNILFTGSCRMSPLMYYWHILYPQYNIYNIYIPHWTDRSNIDKQRIKTILANTDLIISETVKNFGILNTDRDIKDNFFETFDTCAKEIRVSNLELHMYHHDLHNVYKKNSFNEKTEEFIISSNRLKNSLISNKQQFIWTFIENNLKNIKLFATHSHPTNILSIASFIHIINELNNTIDMLFIEKIINELFLQGHCTPIMYSDIEAYDFKFSCPIFPNNTIDDSSYRYMASKQEALVPLSAAEELLSYIK